VGRLYLVRHGQAQWQLTRDEDLDSALSPIGHAQSRALAKWLPNSFLMGTPSTRPARLFTSPMRRARETTSYLAEALSMEAEVREDLREAPFRVGDRLPVRDGPFLAESSPPAADYLAYRDQATEALRALYGAAEEARASVLAVTHGGFIKTLLRVATGSDQVCFEIFNATATVLEWRERRWQLVHLSLWDHLEPVLRTR
jgi:probable phosphoglycerate mutase